MKKLSIICLTICCLFLSGCGTNITLDLEKINTELPNLTTDKFDILGVTSKVEDTNKTALFDELSDVFDYDLKNHNINNENIDKLVFRTYDEKGNNIAYALIKPKTDKKEEVKKEVEAYIKANEKTQDKNHKLYEGEYEGYLVYIMTEEKNHNEVLNRIKSAKEPVFGMLMKVTDDTLEQATGLKKENIEEYAITTSVITQANAYFIIKPAKGKKEEVKKAMDEYMKKQEEQWSTYLVDQYELVKNRTFEEYEGYLIYIISNNNDLVLKKIKELKK